MNQREEPHARRWHHDGSANPNRRPILHDDRCRRGQHLPCQWLGRVEWDLGGGCAGSGAIAAIVGQGLPPVFAAKGLVGAGKLEALDRELPENPPEPLAT